MFLKPIRVKSNSQMKNSERKALKSRVIQKFPSVKDNELDEVISNKDPVSSSKIITHLNNVVTVYSVKKRPMLFEHEDILYPTVYFMWHFPDILRCFTTHPPVLPKLSSGADLMLPGVVLPEMEGPAKFGRFEKNTVVAVNVTSNKAAFAIGKTAHSSMDMYMAAGRGKCVTIIHTLCDHLCQMEGAAPPAVPVLGPPDWLIIPDPETCEEKPSESEPNSEISEAQDNHQNIDEDNVDNITTDLENTTLNNTEEMDKLLIYCFLKTIRYSFKKITLPILTSNFYRLHMINACPSGKTLDIKKSSYKKLNKFLNEMKTACVINVVEQTKGVETITQINVEHPLVTSFIKDQDDVNEPRIDFDSRSLAIDVEEAFTVTAAVLPIFSDIGLRKGDSVKPADVRKQVTEYVKKKKLQSLENRGIVLPNKELGSVVKTEQPIAWEDVMQKIFSAMSSSYKINYGGTQLSGGKGKVEPIIISVGSRSGNKKVTLVDNLELFGIRAADFGKECQHGVAASTSVTKPPGKKCDQLLIQGNQVAFVGNLLMGKYSIPKRFIRGLELAVKSKK